LKGKRKKWVSLLDRKREAKSAVGRERRSGCKTELGERTSKKKGREKKERE